MVLSLADVIAFVPTTDLERARDFYGEVLGLRLLGQDEYALVCDANGTMVRIAAVETFEPAAHTVLGWQVRDIRADVRDLVTRGVQFLRYAGMEQDEDGVWTTPGGEKVAWFADPDGNTLSLTQFPL